MKPVATVSLSNQNHKSPTAHLPGQRKSAPPSIQQCPPARSAQIRHVKLNKNAIVVAWNRIQSRIGITDGEARALLAVSCLLLVGAVAGPVLDERDRVRNPVVYLPSESDPPLNTTANPLQAASGDSIAGPSSTISPVTAVAEASDATRTRIDARIDINSAGVDELVLLPGVGPAIAERIVDYRERYGPYSTVEELAAVRGIGPKTLSRIRDKARI